MAARMTAKSYSVDAETIRALKDVARLRALRLGRRVSEAEALREIVARAHRTESRRAAAANTQ